MDNNNNFDYEKIPKPRYVSEYRKVGDIIRFRRYGEKSYIDRLILQTFISLIIIAVVLLINNINTSFTRTISQGIKSAISWNIDLSKAVDTFSNIRNIIPNAKKNLLPQKESEPVNTNSVEVNFIKPVEGDITSSFGERVHPVFLTTKMHNGIDIEAALGTPIKSSTDGTVIKVAEDDINGNYIKIQTDQYQIAYLHCYKTDVTEGQQVMQGDIIGQVGDSGVTSGPHLHFEILENGVPIDPATKLDFQ